MCLQSTTPWRPLTAAVIAACCIFSLAAGRNVARAAAPSRQSASAKISAPVEGPRYPRITLSTWYKVDPNWPQRPENVPWGRTPGIAHGHLGAAEE